MEGGAEPRHTAVQASAHLTGSWDGLLSIVLHFRDQLQDGGCQGCRLLPSLETKQKVEAKGQRKARDGDYLAEHRVSRRYLREARLVETVHGEYPVPASRWSGRSCDIL